MRLLFVENDAVFGRVVVQEFLAEHEVTIVGTIAEALRALDEPWPIASRRGSVPPSG